MSMLFLSLFLVIFVLFFVTLRIFVPKVYSRQQNLDSLSILPILMVIVCILILNGYGLTHTILIALFLSVFVFLVNVRRFYNLCIGLNRDDYHPLFKIVSIIQNILLLAFLVLLLVYFPPILKTQKAESSIFYGSHKAGFFVKTSLLEKTSAKLDVYFAPKNLAQEENEQNEIVDAEKITETTEETYLAQENSESTEIQEVQIEEQTEEVLENPVEKPKNVIYISDIFVTNQDAQGTLSYLADKGYDVYAFTFFDKLNYFNNFMDSKTFFPFFLRYEYKKNPENIEKNKEIFIHQKTSEFTSALTLMESMGKLPAFILAEGNCIEVAEIIREKYPQVILGIYKINVDDKIEGYIDGFANLQQTKPLEAKILGFPHDKSWDNAKRIAFFADKKFTTYQTYNNLQNLQ